MEHNAAALKRIGVDPSNWRWFGTDYSRYSVVDPEVIPDTVVKDKPRSWIKIGMALLCVLTFGYMWWDASSKAGPNPAAYIASGIAVFAAVTLSFSFLRWIGWLMSVGLLFAAVVNYQSGRINDAFVIAGSMAVLSLGYFLIKWSKPVKGSVTKHPQPKELLWNSPAKRVFGTAGMIADAADVFGKGAVEAGARGEKSTAVLLDLLLSIPGTAVFHGLRFPGSQNADVDHAVTHGNTVFLIDSKQYRSGTYEWGGVIYTDNDGHEETGEAVLRDGEHVIENHMDSATSGYRAMLGTDVTVIPLVMIHGYGVKIGRKMTSENGVHLLTPDAAMEYIGNTCADALDEWEDSTAVRRVLLDNLK